jgi:hypothetical protein
MTGDPVSPADAEEAVRAALTLPPAQAALLLATICRRAAIALHQVARAEAEAHRGQPDWPAWAKLHNASRDAVVRTTALRDAANGVTDRTDSA